MRLIDADALKEKAYSVTVKNEWHMHESIDVVDVEDVDKMLTVDAEPVRHGKWIRIDYYTTICSVCGVDESAFIHGTEDWFGRGESKFCPNCGAKMEDDNETD